MQVVALFISLLALAGAASYHREDEPVVWVRCRLGWFLAAYVNEVKTRDDCVTVLNNFNRRGYDVVGHGAGAYHREYHSEYYSWTLQKRRE